MKCAAPRNKNARARRPRLAGALACFGSCFTVMFCFCVQAGTVQSSATPSQAEIRAAFVFNFVKFTEWPMQAYADAGSPLTTCFLGADDVRAAFQSISTGKALNGRFLENRAVKSAADMRNCQVLYVDSPRSPVVIDVLKNARQHDALAIGTSEDFLASGGMLRLQVENNRMRFDVNVGAIARTKIKLSSKLLALARSVVNLPEPTGN
jgi:YfiR/HmsC-like